MPFMRKRIIKFAIMCMSTAVVNPVVSAEASFRVIEPPANVITNVGGATSFRGRAQPASDVVYQWFHGDQPLAGATNAICVLSPVPAADAGAYQVVARTVTGSLPLGA